jgi:drug/metabolite transporter (DMT)-like permease
VVALHASPQGIGRNSSVIAVLGGLGAAVCWAGAALSAARASRLIGARNVLAWVMLVGFVVVAPLTLAAGYPHGLGAPELGWIAVAGAGNVAGLLCSYEAMRLGRVSIVAPITSTEGAIAAVLAVATGEALGVGSLALLGAIAVGVVLASRTETADAGQPTRSTLLAVCAAACFGSSLFATARVSDALPLVFALIPPRLVGIAAITVPSAVTRRLLLTRAALPLVVVSGLCEVGGFTCYAIGARHGIAVSAVLASQFAALAAVAAYFLFHERLRPPQVVGVATIAIGVALLTALRV